MGYDPKRMAPRLGRLPRAELRVILWKSAVPDPVAAAAAAAGAAAANAAIESDPYYKTGM